MATSISELELFHRFIAEKLDDGGKDMQLDDAIRAFRAYQRELESLRRAVNPALKRSLAGKSKPFDANHLKARVTAKLAKKGIRE